MLGLSGERVVGAHGHAARIGPQRQRLQAGPVERPNHYGYVGDAVAHAAGGVGDLAESHLELDLGVPLAEERQRGPHRLVVGGHHKTQREGLGALPGGAGGGHRAIGAAEHGTGVLEHGLAGRRELHLAGGALEQLLAHPVLQLADLGAERLLGEVQPVGRPREVELLRHGHEGTQVPQLDAHAAAV